MAKFKFSFQPDSRAAEVTNVADFDEKGEPGRPLVIMVHGTAGFAEHWTDPSGSVPFPVPVHYDFAGPPPASRPMTGPGPYPPPGTPLVNPPPCPDNLLTVESWRSFLRRRGFRTVVYTQWNSIGPLSGSAMELAALVAALDPRIGDRPGVARRITCKFSARLIPIAFLAHSRGGVVVRDLLKNLPATLGLDRLRSVVTLHSPHQGSALANVAAAIGQAAAGLAVAPASLVPRLRASLATFLLRAAPGGATADDLAVGSAYLRTLARKERALPGVKYFTHGGANITLTRLYEYRLALTPGNAAGPIATPFPMTGATPFRGLPPLPRLSPFPDVLLASLPPLPFAFPGELTPGLGDWITTDEATHLSFESNHTTRNLHHFGPLWDRDVMNEVAIQL